MCGEKWTGRGHKCPPNVSLHVIQELLDAVQMETETDYDSAEEDSEAVGGQVMAVQQTSQNTKKGRTLRFRGVIGQQEILILLDSGSAGTFITAELAEKLKLAREACNPLSFMAADGSTMVSDGVIPQLQWHIQGHTFQFDTRILPFKGYDLILGADWLEEHGSMWFHWKKKCMKFTHQRKRILLQGVKDELTQCTQLPAHKLKGLLKKGAVSHMLELQHSQSIHGLSDQSFLPVAVIEQSQTSEHSDESALPPTVKSILQQYDHLFQEPATLPPQREFDHHIPLIAGAQPVNVRPYRYAPPTEG